MWINESISETMCNFPYMLMYIQQYRSPSRRNAARNVTKRMGLGFPRRNIHAVMLVRLTLASKLNTCVEASSPEKVRMLVVLVIGVWCAKASRRRWYVHPWRSEHRPIRQTIQTDRTTLEFRDSTIAHRLAKTPPTYPPGQGVPTFNSTTDDNERKHVNLVYVCVCVWCGRRRSSKHTTRRAPSMFANRA